MVRMKSKNMCHILVVIISFSLLLFLLSDVCHASRLISTTTPDSATTTTTTREGTPVLAHENTDTNVAIDWDLLASQPYMLFNNKDNTNMNGGGGSRPQQHGTKRSIEEIRQILLSNTGNANEFEINDMAQSSSIDDDRASVEHKYLAQDYNYKLVNGHYIRLNNPRHHFSIVQPRAGCSDNVDGRARLRDSVSALQSQSSSDPNYKVFDGKNVTCLWATNAGFFDTSNGHCLGNVVSNGKLIQSAPLRNVNFATTKAGKIMVGYMGTVQEANILLKSRTNNPEDEIDNMVGGVIWLVRNGQSFVSESQLIEEMSTQKSGPRFVTLRASRIALGHDDAGRIIIVQMDGDGGHEKGPNLEELTNLLISLGVKNAINIDGGGSATVLKGFRGDSDLAVLNYPSDSCSGMYRCERAVTTFTCIHDSLLNNTTSSRESPDAQFNKQYCEKEYSRLLQIVLLLAGGLGAILVVNLLFICSAFIYSRLYPIQRAYGKALLEEDESISDDHLYLSEDEDDAVEIQPEGLPTVELREIRM